MKTYLFQKLIVISGEGNISPNPTEALPSPEAETEKCIKLGQMTYNQQQNVAILVYLELPRRQILVPHTTKL